MTKDTIQQLYETLIGSLKSLNFYGNWFDLYQEWSSEENNYFDSILYIENAFSPDNAGERQFFDFKDPTQTRDRDLISIACFCSYEMKMVQSKTLAKYIEEPLKNNKIVLLKDYFSFVDEFINKEINETIVVLKAFSDNQAVLAGKREIDLYSAYFSLLEILQKSSVESLFLLFSYWRLTQDNSILELLIDNIGSYIQRYYYDFGNDPEMHLDQPLDELSFVQKMGVITNWLEYVVFYTTSIFEEYKQLEWLRPKDSLFDGQIVTNQISKYQMLKYNLFYKNDSEDLVRKKAICNHSYGIWVKTADVLTVFCEIYVYLLSFTGNKKYTEIELILLRNQQDLALKLRDHYVGHVFLHRAYYEKEKKYIDSGLMEALEDKSEIISGTIDQAIGIINSIETEDLDGLLQAKQTYLMAIQDYISEEQEETLDKLIYAVCKKIEEQVSKTDLFNDLYKTVSSSFSHFSTALLGFPKLFNTLTSAEYLYKEYVEASVPKESFDYSCISVMYYLALEDMINQLIYTPYSKAVLSGISNNDWKSYVTHQLAFWDRSRRSYKEECELGNLGYLLSGVNRLSPLKDFVIKKYPKVDLDGLEAFGKTLKTVAPRRNNAAHGGNYLSYSDAVEDKKWVYYANGIDYRGLLLELMALLFG